MKRIVFRVALLASGVLATATFGCGETQGTAKNVDYSETARENYDKGIAEYNDENYLEAISYFTFVKNRFPFSRYAILAELRLADTYFGQEKYAEAADAYKLFIRFHPTHPDVIDGYAAYQVCRAYVKQIPDEWFMTPPAHEKDQSATRDALRETASFIAAYPDSKYHKSAEDLYQTTIKKLVDHELYVANFYLDRDKPRATIMRLEGIIENYPDSADIPKVMMLLGETYLKLKQYDRARETFASLIEKYPSDERTEKAKRYLEKIN